MMISVRVSSNRLDLTERLAHATSEAERAKVRSAFERDEAELGRLVDGYERG